VQQQLPQPGEQFLALPAMEAGKVALGLEERLLHQVGRALLGLQGRVQFLPGDSQKIAAVRFQGPAEGFP
jgi:hypothetical protein